MEVKSCPFCGDIRQVEIIQPFRTVTHMWAVNCDNCGALGPLDGTQADAARCWNMRATAPSALRAALDLAITQLGDRPSHTNCRFAKDTLRRARGEIVDGDMQSSCLSAEVKL